MSDFNRVDFSSVGKYVLTASEEYMNEGQRKHLEKLLLLWRQSLMEKVINDILKNQNLVTKHDLAKNLAELKLELTKWILGTGIAGVLAIAGMLKYLH